MPVKKDDSGRRSVASEAEVPGTPEQVWNAIATGPGVSSWFVPTEFEANATGTPVKITAHFGPGNSMDSIANVTEWSPPHRLVAESPGETPEAPSIATEWTVEARTGGTCIVRVVHSWFSSSDEWDGQFEGTQHGWVVFFRILRLYLSEFAGQPCSAFQLMAFTPQSTAEAWTTLMGSLGVRDPKEDQPIASAEGAPQLAGVVRRYAPPEYPELLVRLERPAPGIAHFFAMAMGGSVCVPARFYLYGESAAAAVAREEPRWQAWINQQFTPLVNQS
jgi:uncharacterized protein YndB with AHSA1/START domain